MSIVDILCPWLTIRRQRRIIDQLQARLEHTAAILANPGVTGMQVAQQQLEIGLRGPLCEYMSAVLGGLVMGCPETENYLELSLQNSDGRFLVIVTRPRGGQSPHQLRKQAEAEAARLREQLAQVDPPNPLTQQALEVLEALAELVVAGECLTIAKNWGFGGATLIAPDGSHTHVGGDWGETREENLALFVEGMHQLLVQGSGLSWAPAAQTPAKEETTND